MNNRDKITSSAQDRRTSGVIASQRRSVACLAILALGISVGYSVSEHHTNRSSADISPPENIVEVYEEGEEVVVTITSSAVVDDVVLQMPEGLLSVEKVDQWAAQIMTQELNAAQQEVITAISTDVDLFCKGPVDEQESLIEVLAKICTNEIGGLTDETAYSTTRMEEAAVVWCVLNRAGYAATPEQVIQTCKERNQFAYRHYTQPDADIMCTVEDVLIRWIFENHNWCATESVVDSTVGRTLPATYLFFTGDGEHNHFREAFKSTEHWDWCYADPYAQ